MRTGSIPVRTAGGYNQVGNTGIQLLGVFQGGEGPRACSAVRSSEKEGDRVADGRHQEGDTENKAGKMIFYYIDYQ